MDSIVEYPTIHRPFNAREAEAAQPFRFTRVPQELLLLKCPPVSRVVNGNILRVHFSVYTGAKLLIRTNIHSPCHSNATVIYTNETALFRASPPIEPLRANVHLDRELRKCQLGPLNYATLRTTPGRSES